MSSCHLSLAKPEFYPQNFRVEAPQPLPEAQIIDLKGLQRRDAALASQPGVPKRGACGQVVDLCVDQLEGAQTAI